MPAFLPRPTGIGLWAAIATLCAGCAGAPAAVAPAGPQSPPPPSLTAVPPGESLQQLAGRHGICGAAVAVIHDRALHSVEAVQACAGAPQATPHSIFEAASLSKPVFAYAVLKLVQHGRMALDAPVLDYLPDGYRHRQQPYLADSPADAVSDPRLRAVTVRMALNHTSGLPNWAGGPLAFSGTPGQAWEYSGEAYVLLQRAVEQVTGEDLDAFMARQVFVPLGMAHSAYTRQPGFEPFILPGTDRKGTALRPWPFRVPVAAFTLYTSAGDYGRFLAALLKDQRTLDQIVESPVPVPPRRPPDGGLGWGLGWGVEQGREGPLLWHWGNNPGYRAFAMVSPRGGDGFVLLTSSDNGMALAAPVGRQVLPGAHQAYRFHLLRDGLANLLCETLDLCA